MFEVSGSVIDSHREFRLEAERLRVELAAANERADKAEAKSMVLQVALAEYATLNNWTSDVTIDADSPDGGDFSYDAVISEQRVWLGPVDEPWGIAADALAATGGTTVAKIVATANHLYYTSNQFPVSSPEYQSALADLFLATWVNAEHEKTT